MEEKIFPRPAVAAELEKYVEARLHTDGGPQMAVNRGLQQRLGGSVALPLYVIVDPRDERVLRRTAGLKPGDSFVSFLDPSKADG
jgi:thiol:disulfide interchange protein DsbD